MFGGFECIDDKGVAEALFSAAEEWLIKRGIVEIRGPINPVAESWGFLLEGNTSPVFMSPHNPLYYNDFIEFSGYSKAKDLVVYEADTAKGYDLPERFINFDKKILENRKNLSVRNINKKELQTEALHILNILNASVADNWGFVPVEKDEMISIVKTLKLILDEEAILFVEDQGVPVAVALGFPDINIVLKKINGRLNPLSIYRLIRERKHITDYRLWGLAVLPEYQGQGLDVLLYVQLYKALKPRKIRLEANYMLEDNYKILNALEKMNLTQIKKYRVYQKVLV
jgi:GNAT superfamily N-acetyltransferase